MIDIQNDYRVVLALHTVDNNKGLYNCIGTYEIANPKFACNPLAGKIVKVDEYIARIANIVHQAPKLYQINAMITEDVVTLADVKEALEVVNGKLIPWMRAEILYNSEGLTPEIQELHEQISEFEASKND